MLGSGAYEAAYQASKKLVLYGAVGAAVLSAVIILFSPAYVAIYQVEPAVKQLTVQILFVYALIAPVKVLNMILGGGIIRSGGKTKYVMVIDMIGTWGFGVPLGLLAAFALKLTIPLFTSFYRWRNVFVSAFRWQCFAEERGCKVWKLRQRDWRQSCRLTAFFDGVWPQQSKHRAREKYRISIQHLCLGWHGCCF